MFYYIKESILIHHQIPYWNNVFFAGTPLLPDPQNPSWYIPNIIFLFTSINAGILISILLHFLFGAIGMYLTSKSVFSFSKGVSVFVSIIYSLSPIYFSFLEAGHWGLLICWAWIPYLILSAHRLVHKPNLKYILLFAASASSLYISHVLTGVIVLSAVCLYWLYKKSFKWTIPAGVLALVMIVPIFLLQYEWMGETTRNFLLKYPETFPIWRGKQEFIKSFFIFNKETEKAITFGVAPTFLAFIGFLKISRRIKLCILIFFSLIILLILNNVSPLFPVLIKLNPFILMRVSIRFWPLVYIVLLYLLGLGLSKMQSKIRFALAAMSILELLLIGTLYLEKPFANNLYVPDQVYQYLSTDKQIFKVFCTTRCLSQMEAARYGLHLAEGYGTLQQKNYFDAAKQIGQYYSDKYTLSVPPFDIYLYNKLQPHAPTLAHYGIKYVISPHKLEDKNLEQIVSFENYTIYKNKLFTDPKYLIYTPNFIRVDTRQKSSNLVTIPEIYNKNWKAYLNGTKETLVIETKEATRQVIINEDTNFVDFRYK